VIREPFDEDWYVEKESEGDSDSRVGPVTVPYDAMLFERRDPTTPNRHHTGFYPGGAYRYSKSFPVPEEWRGSSVALEFEGVYMRSEVFVNGRSVGGRPSGYAIFRVELDDFLEYGADNLVEVVARNDQMPNSRWYTGSGIYRPVHLLIGGRVRISPDGPRFSTRLVDGGDAIIDVESMVINDGVDPRAVTLTTHLVDARGDTAGFAESQVSIGPDLTMTLRQQVSVSRAELWSPDTPSLYSGRLVLTDGPETLDQTTDEFGIRTLEVDSHRGMRINGAAVKLRGACIHHDNGVIGAHTLDAAEDRRIRILKESGYNAIRSAHNPVARATLRACDRHGVLVMDELTDAWRRPKVTFDASREFSEWWERDLESMIAKDFNHPAVVLYSIGNEIAETATDRGIELNRQLSDRARSLDPTRFVTNCINGFLNLLSPMDDEKLAKKDAAKRESGEAPNKNLILVLNYLMGVLDKTLKYIVRLPVVDKRTRDAFGALDIAGYNYMAGRYRVDGKRHPGRVIVGSETNPTETVAIWNEIERLPYVIGDFTWTGWDYIGEAGYAAVHYNQRRRQIYSPWPALLAGMPVIDITGHRQTQSYLNEIAWGLRRGPYLAVQPVNHAGEERAAREGRTDSIRSWSWEGCEGRVAVVEVYANADRVDLLLDGVKLGTEPAGAVRGYLATFSVPYRAGELTAVAYEAGGVEVGRDTLTNAGAGLQLRAEPECGALRADGADLAYIPIMLTDDVGTIRPLCDREVTVQVSGAGTLLGLGSAQPITEEGFSSECHSTYYGRALAVVRSGHEVGEVTVTVSADECLPTTLVIPVKSAEPGGPDEVGGASTRPALEHQVSED
jgi:beta-galactosidase